MEKSGSDADILFEEIQQFRRASVRDFIKVLLGIVFIALIVSLVLQKGRMTDYNRLLILILPLLLVANFILGSRLILQIRTDGVYVRFPHGNRNFQVFSGPRSLKYKLEIIMLCVSLWVGVFGMPHEKWDILSQGTVVFRLFLKMEIQF